MHRAGELGRQWAAYGFDARRMLALTQFMLGEWDEAAATARIDTMTPGAAAASLRGVGLAVRGGRGDTAVAEDLERLRKWWTLDVMLPIIGLQPAVDAYRALDQVAEAEKLIADVSDVVCRGVPDRMVHGEDPVLGARAAAAEPSGGE